MPLSSVPAHKSPRPSSNKLTKRLLMMPGELLLLKIVNRAPSNRASPSTVASHR